MTGRGLRFGILCLQDAPVPELANRWRLAGQLGFDLLYVADHTGDYRDLRGYWLDGWTVLTAIAAETTSIRIGTLVSNPILRHPVMLAKAAVAIDHLSSGRLEEAATGLPVARSPLRSLRARQEPFKSATSVPGLVPRSSSTTPTPLQRRLGPHRPLREPRRGRGGTRAERDRR